MRTGKARSRSQCTINIGKEHCRKDSFAFQIFGNAGDQARGNPRTQAASRNEVNAEERIRRVGRTRPAIAVAIPLPMENPRSEMGTSGTRDLRVSYAESAFCSQRLQSIAPVLLP